MISRPNQVEWNAEIEEGRSHNLSIVTKRLKQLPLAVSQLESLQCPLCGVHEPQVAHAGLGVDDPLLAPIARRVSPS